MTPVLVSYGVVLLCVCLIWLISLKLRDASVADIWWGPGFAVIAWVAGYVAADTSWRLLAVQLLLSIWGLRLGLHLGLRNWGHDEDRRYQAMRGERSGIWWGSLFKVFILQGSIQMVVSAPVFGMLGSDEPLGLFDGVGMTVLAVGIAIEAIADTQLKRFLSDPLNSGRVMDQGLWGWSRHPNYFGNAVIWLGVGIVGVAAGGPLWTCLGPLLMLFLLLRVSGVTMLESTIAGRRPEYSDYVRRVSSFVPFPPRK
jgi:steroid 5-alpha reductase family enzyme